VDRNPSPAAKRSMPKGAGLRPVPFAPTVAAGKSHIDVSDFLDPLYDSRYSIAAITVLAVILGLCYAVLAAPVYQSDILIQVEDNSTSANDLLSSVSQMFDIKSAASDEIDILNSRLVLGTAVEENKLYIQVAPKRFPVIGRWWASRHVGLAKPGLFGRGGYLWAQENLVVPTFNTPAVLEGKAFKVTAGAGGDYSIDAPFADLHAHGHVGQLLSVNTSIGPVELQVDTLQAQPGGVFYLSRLSPVSAVEALQHGLRITQTSKDSDVIRASLLGTDPVRTSQVLTAIGQEYIHQNVERKSAEAEKSISFLNVQLPQLKAQLEQSEDAYNAFRARNGTLNLSDEGSAVLTQMVDTQNKLADLEQKRRELSARFTENHPAVIAVAQQAEALKQRLEVISSQTRRLPELEQTELRLQREMQANSDLYTSLLNSAQQLRLARAGKTGNARLVDQAVVSELPVKPNRKLVVVLAGLLGLSFGCLVAWVRSKFAQGVLHARDIERDSGLSVYVSVPLSKPQRQRDQRNWPPLSAGKISLLAHLDSDSLPIESLRSFRTALQYVMLEAANNIVLITGPTPGVGKTFTVANLAAVFAASNQRVLLIDADMRAGDMHRHFGLTENQGLAELLADTASVESVIRAAVLPRLDVITRGRAPARPSELLTSKRLARLLGEMSAQYDLVLVDTPPVLAVTDVGVIGRMAGASFLVVRQGETTLAQIKESTKRLAQVGVPLDGIVLNGVMPRPGDRGYGVAAYSYSASASHVSEA
jgi:tyrosine-protein kinase Etk/Wzc